MKREREREAGVEVVVAVVVGESLEESDIMIGRRRQRLPTF